MAPPVTFQNHDRPIPTTRAPPNRLALPNKPNDTGAKKLTRGKTLTRPERHVQPAALINPSSSAGASGLPNIGGLSYSDGATVGTGGWGAWTMVSRVVTFWAPSFLLTASGIKGEDSQQAWREKVTLCLIAIGMGGLVGFATVGLTSTFCPAKGSTVYSRIGSDPGK